MHDVRLANNPATQWFWVIVWSIIAIIFLATLPGYTEHDAYTYVAIAKQMLTTHHYLVPFRQGHPYSDKPPLLFWLFVLGWKVFGFNTWWPQVVALVFATGSVIMTRFLAKQCWPTDKTIWQLAPTLLVGTYYWLLFSKQIRVDQLLIFFTLTALASLLAAMRGAKWAWFAYAVSIAFGVMAKGPIIFLFALLPAMVLPFWNTLNHLKKSHWIGMLLLAGMFGLLATLAWIIPAMLAGGKQYSQQILYGQILHRTHIHARHRDWLFYLSHLPIWLLPWSFYWPLWRGMRRLKYQTQLPEKFCLLILAIGLFVFNIFGQKEPYYLLPLTPIFALLAARVLYLDSQKDPIYKRSYQWPMAGFLLAVAVAWLILRHVVIYQWFPLQAKLYFLQEISLAWPLGLLVVALGLFAVHFKSLWQQVIALIVALLILQIVWYDVITPTFNRFNEQPEKLLHKAALLQQQGQTLAVYGVIHGIKADKVLGDLPHLSAQQWAAWAQSHPHAWLITASPCILMSSFNQQKPWGWYYQGYTSSVSLWRVTTLMNNQATRCE